jgi:ADYC domain
VRRLGFPLAGAFTGHGRHIVMPGRFLITCTGAPKRKCVRFGYKPWRQGPDGASLLAYYQTCVRLVRADYCGDGIGHTRNGTPIDLFDRIGIQPDEAVLGMTFEAAWGPDGAVCVRHTRLKEALDAAVLLQQCPRLARYVGENATRRRQHCCSIALSSAEAAMPASIALADGTFAARTRPEGEGVSAFVLSLWLPDAASAAGANRVQWKASFQPSRFAAVRAAHRGVETRI